MRKAFARLDPATESLLAAMGPELRAAWPALVERFYEQLRAFDDTRSLLADPATLERLKGHQARYLEELFGGRYDAAYADSRRRMGSTHARIGLAPRWYVGAYSVYIELLLPEVRRLAAGDWDRALAMFQALARVVFFDVGLTLDAYAEGHRADVEARDARLDIQAAALDAVADPVVITDPSGSIVWVNRAFTRLNGWRLEEVVGQNPRILKSGESDPSIYPAMWAEVTAGRSWAGDVVNRQRDGRTYVARLTVAPVLGPDGRPSHFVGTHRDVTARREAEEALRRSEAGFRTLIEKLPDALAVHRDGYFVFVNPKAAELLGYDGPEVLLGRSVLEIVHPDDRQAVVERLASSAPNGTSREIRFVRRDGSTTTAEITGLRISFEGKPSVLVAARDVSARKELTARMMQLDRAIAVGTLAAGVAHEINNPLSYVMSNVEYVASGLAPLAAELRARGGDLAERWLPHLEEFQVVLDQAGEGADRIRRIVLDLKTLSRGEEDVRQLVDLPGALEASISMTWNEIRHRSRLVKEFGPTPPVAGNGSRLGQVFVNLLVNAAQAIPEGRAEDNEIRLSTSTDAAGRAVIEVRDTGSGIAPELLPRLFDPFFTTKPIGQGTGLGLSICQRIVREHGGELTVESAPGLGSLFRVTLPPAQPVPAAPPERSAAAAASKRGRVLVVDDESLVAVAVRRALEGEHEVVVTTRGREALDLLDRGERFDAVVCDLMMPDFTGMDLHAALLARHPREVERMLFLTGGAFTPAARAFLGDGAKRQMDKPFQREALLAAVRAIVAAARR